ncbi:hypothetical protein V6Z12_A13G106800 [Gossypium hirsutum]
MCLRPLLCSMPILFLLWHLSPILIPLRKPFFQLSFSSSKDHPLALKLTRRIHTLASFLHRTLTTVAWDKNHFLIFFPRHLPLRPMLSRRRNFGVGRTWNVGMPKIRIEIATCRFAAVQKLGTSVFLFPISLSSRTAYSISVLKLALTYSWLGSR